MKLQNNKPGIPRDTAEIQWTHNAKQQMRHYGVRASLVHRVLRSPLRCEQGIADGTIGYMRPFGSAPRGTTLPYRGEVWVLIKNEKRKKKSDTTMIVAVWRYPGVSNVRDPIPLP